MKVLIINGSPRINGNTSIVLDEMKKIFEDNSIDVRIVQVGNQDIRGCIACGYCLKNHRCVFDDLVNDTAKEFLDADGVVIASPVYYSSANGTLVSFLDRLFYSSNFDKTMKVGASVVVARRGGLTATFDELNKYFFISGMPVVSSNYWNGVHGRVPGDVLLDEEGLQTIRILTNNMIFLMRSIELGKNEYGLPKGEKKITTNFIR